MADTQTTAMTVSMTAEFGDGSEKTISQNDPLDDETELITAINAFSNFAKTNNLILSNNNASFSRIKAAKTITKTTTTLDLS